MMMIRSRQINLRDEGEHQLLDGHGRRAEEMRHFPAGMASVRVGSCPLLIR